MNNKLYFLIIFGISCGIALQAKEGEYVFFNKTNKPLFYKIKRGEGESIKLNLKTENEAKGEAGFNKLSPKKGVKFSVERESRMVIEFAHGSYAIPSQSSFKNFQILRDSSDNLMLKYSASHESCIVS